MKLRAKNRKTHLTLQRKPLINKMGRRKISSIILRVRKTIPVRRPNKMGAGLKRSMKSSFVRLNSTAKIGTKFINMSAPGLVLKPGPMRKNTLINLSNTERQERVLQKKHKSI